MNHTKVSSPLMKNRTDFSDSVDPPFPGQIFNSFDEVKDYYFLYASKIGFSIRNGTTKVVNGMLIIRRFLCYMEGFCLGSGTRIGEKIQLRRTR